MSSPRALLTVPEVAELLRCNTDTVYSLINSGALKALKLGRWKVRGEELDRFLREAEGHEITKSGELVPL